VERPFKIDDVLFGPFNFDSKIGEELPYRAIFANRIRDPEGEEFEWASRRAKELGLP